MMQLYRVLYCSRSRISGPPDQVAAELRTLLLRARARNAANGVTGGLLFSDGSFAQVLEGSLAAVEETLERIQCDQRHYDLTVLQSVPIAARDFPDWSMGFVGNASAGPVAGLNLDLGFTGQSAVGDAILHMLRDVVTREDHWVEAAA